MYNAAIDHVLDKLSFYKAEVMRELLKVESFVTAEDEYGCAVKCLTHADEESAYWGDNGIEMFAAFMAVNQPLYGLILGLMSSLAAKETYIRPATDTCETVLALSRILRLDEDFPHFHIVACERQMFLFSGSGVNPMVITETADVALAAQKAVEAGVYNTGQDFGRSELHLVHQAIVKEFLEELKQSLMML